jgi:hypothetical protein
MKSKTTIIWFVLAVALATTIWVLERYFPSTTPGESRVLAGLRPGKITEINIIPSGAREISVVRTNNAWVLQRPFVYPAQAAAVDGLLTALQNLTPVVSLSAGEMSRHKNADAEFGFDNPQFTLDVAAGGQTWHLRVGNKTAPGDGVYVRLVGATGAYVTDPAWLQFLPREANDWRDTTLVDMPGTLDWLVITNGTQAIELHRDATNRLWRMVRPLSARADNLRIIAALQQLRMARVSRFITDDPKADLTTYGLEPAALDVWLGYGTNLLTAVHTGKGVSGVPGEVYARREGWSAIVTTPKEPLAPWQGEANNFRDPNLLELTAPVVEIEMHGENNFTLQQRSNTWTEAGQKFPVDAGLAAAFIQTLGDLQIADFVQDAVTASGLQSFGLASPSRQIILRSAVGDTNKVIVQLLFGATSTNEIYVKRGDEDFVYGLALDKVKQLWQSGDYFRDRRVWNFSETNVAQVTLRQNGQIRQMVRTGTNEWSLAPGSQGIINPPAIEETIHDLGQLAVAGWLGRKFSDADVGLSTNSLSVATELKSGEKYTVDFGSYIPAAKTGLAVVTLDGERWAFVFPPYLYALVAESLTIPQGTP